MGFRQAKGIYAKLDKSTPEVSVELSVKELEDHSNDDEISISSSSNDNKLDSNLPEKVDSEPKGEKDQPEKENGTTDETTDEVPNALKLIEKDTVAESPVTDVAEKAVTKTKKAPVSKKKI